MCPNTTLQVNIACLMMVDIARHYSGELCCFLCCDLSYKI